MSGEASDTDEETKGFNEGVESSSGDPKLLLGMNAVFSIILGWTIIGGLSIIDLAAFTLLNVASLSIATFALTYMIVLN